MTIHLNFGNVINAYVNNVFPDSGRLGQDDSSETIEDDDSPKDIPVIHKITYSTFTAVILGLLLTLCVLTVNVKSVFMVNKSLDYAINGITSPTIAGFSQSLDSLLKTNEAERHEVENNLGSSQSEDRSSSENAEEADHFTSLEKLKTRSEVALWIQFGLIPTLFEGLNTFNRWTTNTVLITFRGKDGEYNFRVPVGSSSIANLSSDSDQPEEGANRGPFSYKYEYDSDNQINYQYVTGSTLREVMGSLMQGSFYLREEPYFPLNWIMSQESVTEVTLDFMTNNVNSNVISYVTLKFDFAHVENVVNGEKTTEAKVGHALKVLSYRINTSLFPMIINGVILAVLIASVIYTVFLYKKHPKSFFLFDYIFDILFKGSVLMSFLFFNGVVFLANFSLPRVGRKNCESGFCECDIYLGYDNINFDHEKLVNFKFDMLRLNIRVAVILFGFLCFFTLLSVFSSLIASWLVINKNRQLSLVYKKYYYHLKFPLLSLALGVSLSILLIAVFNSSVSHMFKSSVFSVHQNFLALLNLILGISNDATLRYIDNYSIIYSILFVALLFISFYFTVLLVTSLLLMFDNKEETLDFDTRQASWKYDSYRLMFLIRRASRRYRRLKAFVNSILFRVKIIERDTKSVILKSDYEPDENEEKQPKRKKFKFSLNSLIKFVTYLSIAVGITVLFYSEVQYMKVARLVSHSLNEMILLNRKNWSADFTTYVIKSSYPVVSEEDKDGTKVKVSSPTQDSKITTYQQLYEWMNDGESNLLFRLVESKHHPKLEEENPKVTTFLSRYDLFPSQKPLLLTLYFTRIPPGNLVEKLKKIKSKKEYAMILKFEEEAYGLKSVFEGNGERFPDTMYKLGLDFVIVDKKYNKKIYNGSVEFDIEKSGMMSVDVRVRNVFSFFLPENERNLIPYGIIALTSVIMVVLVGVMSRDLWNFRNGYRMYYPKTNPLYMVGMYFVNDIKRVFDLLVIVLLGAAIASQGSILLSQHKMKTHIQDMEDVFYRYYYKLMSGRVLCLHSSLAILLSLIVVFGFILKLKTVRHYLYVGIAVLFQMKYLYLNIVFYFMVITFTFLFFFYFISKDYFKEFIKGNKFFKRCVRLILHDHQFFGDFRKNNLTELLLYPLCLTFKIWLTNVIFYHLWSVWPRFEYSKNQHNEEDFLEEPDELEQKFKHSELEVTSISQSQLDILPRDLKEKAAQETINIFNRFKEYNQSFVDSGKHKVKFIESLHEELGNEMNDLLEISNKLEFKVGIVSKQTEVMEEKSYRDLEEQISILEESLADKREELNTVFSAYTSKQS